jgi:hypothetical protein
MVHSLPSASTQLVAYLEWLIDWGIPATLLGEAQDDVQRVQRELVRIGVDSLVATATVITAAMGTWPLSSCPQAMFTDIYEVRRGAGGALRRRLPTQARAVKADWAITKGRCLS